MSDESTRDDELRHEEPTRDQGLPREELTRDQGLRRDDPRRDQGLRHEEPTRDQALHGHEPIRDHAGPVGDPPGHSAPRRAWAALALATACGFLLGVLVVTTVGGTGVETRTETQRVTVPATVTNGGTVITKTIVPAMVGEPLDVAKQRAERARFAVTVDSGGGVFGVIRDENWEVVAQRPGPDELVEQGSTIHVDIVKR